VGSHRQFLLLARSLAAGGIAAMRFDYRGMGDSEGDGVSFEDVDSDIAAAIERFFQEVPELDEVVLWGLCDAASAALFYAHTDPRVTGLVLLNPWVRTESGQAKAYLRHYYLRHIFDADLWRRIFGGRFELRKAVQSLVKNVVSALGSRRPGAHVRPNRYSSPNDSRESRVGGSLPNRMMLGLRRFQGRVLLILSGDDLTAAEFKDAVTASRQWRKLLGAPYVTKRELSEANHTFSRREWRDQVAQWTADWVRAK